MFTKGHGQPKEISLLGIKKTHTFAATQPPHSKSSSAFTLLELLVVVAVICVMLGLLAPAVASMTSPVGRKGAVTIVMNTLEQARVSAIETGRETVVLFWKKNGVAGFPPDEPDGLIILRKNEAGAWESISRWVKLPNGVLFQSENTSSLILTTQADQSMLDAFPKTTAKPTASQSGAVQFTTSGAVKSPSTPSSGLYIAFAMGQRKTGSNEMAFDKQKSGGKEVISLARYTGRSTMDIVDL
jgi:prepilin-type N-terminal cleavage/methylation domain-containing protein